MSRCTPSARKVPEERAAESRRSPSSGDRARVRVGTSPPLVAEVTTGSIEAAAARTGVDVWASFKAVEVHLVVPTAHPIPCRP
jgi:hypothetical protein